MFGEPEAVFQADREALAQVAGLRTKDIDRLIVSRNREQIKRRWDSICSKDILFTCVTHPDYPAKLHHIADPPYALYYKGSLPSEHVPSVAVVGARNASHAGMETAKQIGRELAENGIAVVSGLARGVDIAAQRLSLIHI